MWPKIESISIYKVEISIIIPVIMTLFLDPFIDLFNSYFFTIRESGQAKDEEAIQVSYEINYRGKKSIDFQICSVVTTNFMVTCRMASNQSETTITPENFKCFLSKDRTTETIIFHLTPKNKDKSEPISVNYLVNDRRKCFNIKIK